MNLGDAMKAARWRARLKNRRRSYAEWLAEHPRPYVPNPRARNPICVKCGLTTRTQRDGGLACSRCAAEP